MVNLLKSLLILSHCHSTLLIQTRSAVLQGRDLISDLNLGGHPRWVHSHKFYLYLPVHKGNYFAMGSVLMTPCVMIIIT